MTRSDSHIVTISVPMISTRQFGNLTLLQLLSAAVAFSGHCSAAVAVHCRRQRIYSLQKFLGRLGEGGRLWWDTRFDLSLDWISFCHSCNADQKTRNVANNAFCEHKMQQNATAAGTAPNPRWSSGLYSASPDPLAGFKGSLHGVDGRKQGEGKERCREGGEGRGRMLSLIRSGCHTA